MRWLGSKVFVFGLAITLLSQLAVGAVGYFDFKKFVADQSWSLNVVQAQTTLERLLSALKDVEYAQRSYIYTGDVAFLDSCKQALENLLAAAGELRAVVAQDAAQKARVEALAPKVKERLNFVAELCVLARSSPSAARERLMAWRAGHPLAAISSAVTELKIVEDRLFEQRRQQGKSGALLTVGLLIGSAMLDLVAFSIAISLVAMELARRQRLVEELKENQRFRELFLGIVGHELRDPLGTILMSATALERGGISDEQAAALQRIERTARRMARMIQHLLDFTRGQLGSALPVRFERMDLGQLCRQVIEDLQTSNPERSIRFESAGDCVGMWDPDRLSQVIANLGVNALKYGNSGSPVEIVMCEAEGGVTLSVHNEGGPIAPDLLPVIFDPLRRGTEHGRRTSLGLGLYVSREIVRALGGKIDVSSSPNNGTTFTVWLPKSRQERSASGGASRSAVS